MSTPKAFRRARGRLTRLRRNVGDREDMVDRWLCRRTTDPDHRPGQCYRRLSRLHRSLPKKWR